MIDQFWDVLLKVVIGGAALIGLAWGVARVRHLLIVSSAEARAKVMAQARAVRVPGGVFMITGVESLNRVVGDFYSDDESAESEAAELVAVDEKTVKAHEAAVKVIEASIKVNGADSRKIVSGNKSGLSGTIWQLGKDYLQGLGLVFVVTDGNEKPHTESKDKTLAELMTHLAASSLPQRGAA